MEMTMRKIIILAALFLVLLLSVCLFSPKPTLWLLQHSLFGIPQDDRPKQYLDKNVRVFKDLRYPSRYQKNRFDFYAPNHPLQHKPLIVWIHGGGFIGGDKFEVKEYATRLAYEGYYVMVLNYDLVPSAKYPEPVIQVSEAIRYINTSFANTHHLNSSNLFIAGDSAGAQIALQFLLIQHNPKYAALLKIPAVLEPQQIRGSLLYCGPYDLKDMAQQANSSITRFVFKRVGWAYLQDKNWLVNPNDMGLTASDYLTANLPAIYLTDGNTASFEQQARQLAIELKKRSVPTTTRFFDQATYPTGHEYQFLLKTVPAQLTFKDTLHFLEKNRIR